MTVEVVWLNRAGVFARRGCREDRVHSPVEALTRLRRDMAAWVRPEEAQGVLDAYRAEVAHADNLPAWALGD